ncbi:hypothetical protein BKI52_07995 [marine bacterium AO1-C]|nr:hypothetical protein BKI52_07995 [marine bacterium AO1-C]
MKHSLIGTWILAVSLGFLFSCEKKHSSQKSAALSKEPAHFPKPYYGYSKNSISSEGITLGRKLFFDPILSKNNTVSCGSCHHPDKAYADPNKRLSKGIRQQLTKRNTPGLFNLRWHRTFFADGGVRHFELIPLAPLVNRQEMDGDLKELIKKLQNSPTYRNQFQQVFATDSIQSKHILYALAQFMGTLVSANSRYDQYVSGKVKFTPEEKKGLQIFTEKCSNCHQMTNQLFTDLSFRNIGLDSLSTDPGRYLITELAADSGRFKVPSLRNVLLTFPYMHDGRFATIEEVLQHYDQGVKDAPSLDSLLKKNNRLGIPLHPAEKKALIRFLHTLTDSSFIEKPQPTEQ